MTFLVHQMKKTNKEVKCSSTNDLQKLKQRLVGKVNVGSEVRAPAQVHEAEQVIVCGLLNEVVNVSLDGQRQSHHFIPVLYHTLETLIDVLHVGFSLQENNKNYSFIYLLIQLHLVFFSKTITLRSV